MTDTDYIPQNGSALEQDAFTLWNALPEKGSTSLRRAAIAFNRDEDYTLLLIKQFASAFKFARTSGPLWAAAVGRARGNPCYVDMMED